MDGLRADKSGERASSSQPAPHRKVGGAVSVGVKYMDWRKEGMGWRKEVDWRKLVGVRRKEGAGLKKVGRGF